MAADSWKVTPAAIMLSLRGKLPQLAFAFAASAILLRRLFLLRRPLQPPPASTLPPTSTLPLDSDQQSVAEAADEPAAETGNSILPRPDSDLLPRSASSVSITESTRSSRSTVRDHPVSTPPSKLVKRVSSLGVSGDAGSPSSLAKRSAVSKELPFSSSIQRSPSAQLAAMAMHTPPRSLRAAAGNLELIDGPGASSAFNPLSERLEMCDPILGCKGSPGADGLSAIAWLRQLDDSRRSLEEEWHVRLNAEQFRVLRMKGTEEIHSGPYNELVCVPQLASQAANAAVLCDISWQLRSQLRSLPPLLRLHAPLRFSCSVPTLLCAPTAHTLSDAAARPPLHSQMDEGLYVCAGCEQPLYTSKQKPRSMMGHGWPAFCDNLPDALMRIGTRKIEIVRTRIACARKRMPYPASDALAYAFTCSTPPTHKASCAVTHVPRLCRCAPAAKGTLGMSSSRLATRRPSENGIASIVSPCASCPAPSHRPRTSALLGSQALLRPQASIFQLSRMQSHSVSGGSGSSRGARAIAPGISAGSDVSSRDTGRSKLGIRHTLGRAVRRHVSTPPAAQGHGGWIS